jgi:elongation factor Ts
MEIKNFSVLESNGSVAAYSHMGGRIGALVAISAKDKKDLAYDIAMQVAAADPKYISPEDVPSEETEKEKEIYREQLKKEGKPEQMIEKILFGKLNKYFEEVCLTKQEFIKDDKKRVAQILGDVKVEKFIRYSL